ncbi:TRIM3-like protein, partial [Mya arenaria]
MVECVTAIRTDDTTTTFNMEDVEEIITCSICMEIFNLPCVLPCQHTFCEHCLSSFIKDKTDRKKSNKKIVSCPLCRAVTVIKQAPYDGTAFPKNLTVVALMDSSAVQGVNTEGESNQEPKERHDSEKKEDVLCWFDDVLFSKITLRISVSRTQLQ